MNKVLLAPVDTKQPRKTHRAALDAVAPLDRRHILWLNLVEQSSRLVDDHFLIDAARNQLDDKRM